METNKLRKTTLWDKFDSKSEQQLKLETTYFIQNEFNNNKQQKLCKNENLGIVRRNTYVDTIEEETTVKQGKDI